LNIVNPYLQVAIEAAREAGALLLREFDRPQQISYKGEVDLVTEADRRSEAAIVSKLRCHFPKHTIVAEEGGGQESDSEYRWYVDPLDGTTNFAHSYPCFCVSIGLAQGTAERNDPLVGVVFNPVNGELFTAVKGEGAFLHQKKIRVSAVPRLSASLLSTGFPVQKRTQNANIHYYWDFTMRSHGVRRDGSAALDLCGVACGRFEGFWEFGLKPWDTAAGVLIVREAGGMATDFAGNPYRLGGRELLASNSLVHAEMQQVAADIAAHAGELPG
jgi:myo-inositol-1(or 4)-monophosphatase